MWDHSSNSLIYLTLGTAFGTAELLTTAIKGLATLGGQVVVAAGRVRVADLGGAGRRRGNRPDAHPSRGRSPTAELRERRLSESSTHETRPHMTAKSRRVESLDWGAPTVEAVPVRSLVRPGLAVALMTVAFAVTTAVPPATGTLVRQGVTVSVEAGVRAPPAAMPVLEVDLAGAVAAGVAAADSRMKLGLAVIDLTTGRMASSGGDRPFYSASIAKLIVAVDVLSKDVSPADRERVRRALSTSDDEAMNALWGLHDGVGAVRRVSGLAGMTKTSAPRDPAEWGETMVTADDIARLQAHIQSSPARDPIVAALSAAPARAADGFDQAFGLHAPGVDAYSKQGWMSYRPGLAYLHSAGVLHGRYAVALLSVQQGRPMAAAKERVDAVTRALAGALPR